MKELVFAVVVGLSVGAVLKFGVRIETNPNPQTVEILNQHGQAINGIASYIVSLQEKGILPKKVEPEKEIKK
jgi:hypothetical protein